MNKLLSNCPLMTPQISFFQMARFRFKTSEQVQKTARQYSLLENVEKSFIDEYFKILVLNIRSNVEIDFTSSDPQH